jgi:poly-gamma-glutamate capsule biosynthesis protein CapA/YwtB (metallophosphatase superfamily)
MSAMVMKPARSHPLSREPHQIPREARGGHGDLVTICLAGDVMTGRGIDQILPHPGNPALYEPYVDSASDYVALAEAAHGPIPKPVDFGYVWGDARAELERRQPQLRLVNLETAVTASAEPAIKGINYKMNPANMPALSAAGIEVCALANNHVLDWGASGLIDTLENLHAAGIRTVGAGRSREEAGAPAIFPIPGGGRLLVFAFGSPTSGIPRSWAAAANRPGVNLLPDLSSRTLSAVAKQLRAKERQGDIVVASVHWGGNWGYEIGDEEIAFAHGLVEEAGVDLVHGHSSHHVKAIEVYRDRLILYGCGDFLDDYEGIVGEEGYRDDLVLLYFASVRPSDGALAGLAMVPFQIRQFRLNRASPADASWLRDVLTREGRKFGTAAEADPEGPLSLRWR